MGLASLQALAARPEYEDRVEVKIVRTNDNDAAQQNAAIQNLIAEGVDAILFDPASATGADAAIAQAETAGTRCSPTAARTTTTTSTRCRPTGRAPDRGRRVAVDQLGDNTDVAVLEGLAGVPLNDGSMPGVEDVLTEERAATIVARGTNGWNEADAQKAMAQILQSNPDVGGVYSFLTGGQGVPTAFADAGSTSCPSWAARVTTARRARSSSTPTRAWSATWCSASRRSTRRASSRPSRCSTARRSRRSIFFPPLEITNENAEDFCLPDQPDNFQLGYDFPGLDLTVDEVLAFYQK
ncbi:substrate-binding domain-containing protein [Agromyces flavus]|uniref:substrate-binding domain-containing protein n=1 Tax=Agromyces flavus TaxID=589382 RepID=UPI00361B62DE